MMLPWLALPQALSIGSAIPEVRRVIMPVEKAHPLLGEVRTNIPTDAAAPPRFCCARSQRTRGRTRDVDANTGRCWLIASISSAFLRYLPSFVWPLFS